MATQQRTRKKTILQSAIIILALFQCTAISQAEETGAPATESEGQQRAGFALEVHFGATKPLMAMEYELFGFNTISGGLFLGGKIGRVVLGMGFEMDRIKLREKYQIDGGDESKSENSETSLLFKPGVRFALFQSNDKKVDLFGQVDFGMGTMLFKDDGDDDDDDSYYDDDDDDDDNEPKYLLIGWDVGLGARYWIHPQFALSALGGLDGQYFREKLEESGSESQQSYHTLSVFGVIQILGVFGG